MFEKSLDRQESRKFITKIPKILDLKSSSEQVFSKNWCLGAKKTELTEHYMPAKPFLVFIFLVKQNPRYVQVCHFSESTLIFFYTEIKIDMNNFDLP